MLYHLKILDDKEREIEKIDIFQQTLEPLYIMHIK